ncbi:MAG: DMT family transporter [Pseudomonadota bacterium]
MSATAYMTPGRASAALLLGGAMWGLYWIPVRWLGGMGLSGPFAGMAIYSATILVLSPVLWNQRHGLIRNWRLLILSGSFTGAAFGLFTISLFYTDVVRSILLFYLTPVWSTILGLILLSEPLSLRRMLGIFLGISGLAIVLGSGTDLPLPQNIGDWLALVSGVAWACGTVGLYRSSGVSVAGQVFAFLFGGLVITLAATLLAGFSLPAGFEMERVIGIAGISILLAFYMLPMIWLTVWPATLLSPARVGLLLMSEVVVGLLSASLFANEPFGWRELSGAVLIVGAAVIELASKSADTQPEAA